MDRPCFRVHFFAYDGSYYFRGVHAPYPEQSTNLDDGYDCDELRLLYHPDQCLWFPAKSLSVDVIYAMLPGIVRHIMHIVTYLIFFVPFSFELVPVTYRFFLRAYTTHELGYSVWQPVTWPVRLALFVGMLLLAIQGISEILKHVDWVIEYIRNGCKDPQIDEGPSAAEAVILENGGHIPVDEKGEK